MSPNSQIENRNFISPTSFKFTIQKAPKLAFYGSKINIPSINFPPAEQSNYLTDIPLVGTKLEFGDLNIRFYLDAGLENYMQIQNWMRGTGFPESLEEIYEFRKGDEFRPEVYGSDQTLYSDGTLLILDGQNIPRFNVIFEDLFPVSLTTVEFDSTITDLVYLQADVTFKYSIYTIKPTSDIC